MLVREAGHLRAGPVAPGVAVIRGSEKEPMQPAGGLGVVALALEASARVCFAPAFPGQGTALQPVSDAALALGVRRHLQRRKEKYGTSRGPRREIHAVFLH